jgi:hypothetical protein
MARAGAGLISQEHSAGHEPIAGAGFRPAKRKVFARSVCPKIMLKQEDLGPVSAVLPARQPIRQRRTLFV